MKVEIEQNNRDITVEPTVCNRLSYKVVFNINFIFIERINQTSY